MPTLTEPPSRLTSASTWVGAVQHLSQRLIAASAAIRFHDALAWDPQIEHEFLAGGGRELPRVDRDYYRSRRLPFDPARKQEELQDIDRDVQRTLGCEHGIGRILIRTCREFAVQVRLLAYRGTRTFTQISQRLYGSALSPETATWLATLDELQRRCPAPSAEADVSAEDAAGELQLRLRSCFPSWDGVQVKLVDGANAETGPVCDGLKLARDRRYTRCDLRFHEVHDGWVHLGTTYNGRRQPLCQFVTTASASAAGTQAGLARLAAFAAGAMSAERVELDRRRIEAVRMAESGADFCEVYRFFRDKGETERDCYRHAQRVFRGSLPQGCGPFTRDLATAAGICAIRDALTDYAGQQDALALLFCGKTAVEDLDALRGLSRDGWLMPPAFLPPLLIA